MGHDVCDTMGASVTVKTGFVDEVIDSLSVSGQCTGSQDHPQRTLLRCTRSSRGSASSKCCISGEEYLILS